MCITPNHVWVQRGPGYEKQPVACRQCWRCRQNRVNDYVARAMCEASTSQVSCTVNFTYRDRDDLAEKVVTPRHFQLFMKLLRKSGHKVRYLVAGEYGEKNGRAHFHAILFFSDLKPGSGKVPAYNAPAAFCREIPQKRMVHIDEWPHGHVTVDWSASESSIRYVCWYLQLDDKNTAWFSLSKKPALGAVYFARKAAKMKALGLPPRNFQYLPPGGTEGRPYLMTGATRRDFLMALAIPNDHRQMMSEWVRKSHEKFERDARLADILKSMKGRSLPEIETSEEFDRFSWHFWQEEWAKYHDKVFQETGIRLDISEQDQIAELVKFAKSDVARKQYLRGREGQTGTPSGPSGTEFQADLIGAELEARYVDALRVELRREGFEHSKDTWRHHVPSDDSRGEGVVRQTERRLADMQETSDQQPF